MASLQRACCGLLQLGVRRKPTDAPLLRASAGAVKERLYVLLRGDWGPLSLSQATARLQFVYQQVAQAGYPALDVRVLLPGGGPDAPELEALLGPDGADDELATINEARESKGLGLLGFVRLSSEACAAAPPAEAAGVAGADDVPAAAAAEPSQHAFEHAVCLGGTFDYLHTGHKLLLSMGALACGVNARLVVGVSDAPLLRKKVLREMMQPLPLRLALVADFVNSVAPHLRLELTALQDGYGPAGSNAGLQAIVVSAESLPGGHACNARRKEGGLAPLEVLCLPLVDEAGEGGEVSEEDKLSSSSVRKARLAMLQRGDESTWARVTPPGTPYVVGLTGGIAAGKSTVARHLRDALGATCLDCDQLAHEAYAPGTAACAALVAAFGSEIVGDGGAIDRRALGAKAFADKAAMARLCEVAWPATAALAAERIAGCGEGLVVMEAAMMLEAGCAAAPCQRCVSVVSAPCQRHASAKPAPCTRGFAPRHGRP